MFYVNSAIVKNNKEYEITIFMADKSIRNNNNTIFANE